MLKLPALFCVLLVSGKSFGQKLDSIFFNLYTDSLKKGTYNYINVEGKFSDGTFQPLGEKELKFSASEGRFSGNSLYIDSATTSEKINVKVVLLKDPKVTRQIYIYIKKHNANERLPTMDEVLNGSRSESSDNKKSNKR